MKQLIAYEIDGGVAIVIPTGETTIEHIIENDIPRNAKYCLISDKSKLPDRYFRGAWKFDSTNGVKVSIPDAKEIQINHWRKARAGKLAALDVESIKASEDGDNQKRAEIANKKKGLRDVTLTPLPDDLDAIKNTWPAILS